MSLDFLLQILQPAFLIKIVAIIFCIMLVIFMLVVAKQVKDMDQTISLGLPTKIVQIVTILSVILAFSLLLTAIVIL